MNKNVFIGVSAIVFVSTLLYAQTPPKPASGAVGRYQIVQVSYETEYSGDGSSSYKSITFAKIDTATGKTWLYKSDVFKTEKPFVVAGSTGWEPVAEERPNLLEEIRRQNKMNGK